MYVCNMYTIYIYINMYIYIIMYDSPTWISLKPGNLANLNPPTHQTDKNTSLVPLVAYQV